MEENFYVDFENNFRGSPEQIYEINSNYDGLINHIIEVDNHPKILDIGCGRGEWLHKCSILGFEALGIELNSRMAEICRNRGINVLVGDALKLLKDLPDNSFSLISIFHLIEHISYESIELLLLECKRILKTEGLVVLETPSIDNLSVASRLFHIDPTHVNPINPDLLVFLMERIGFDKANYFYINGGPLQGDDHDSLTRILNGVAQDLMLIGTKSKISTNLLKKNQVWKKSLKEGLSTIDASVQFDHRLRMKAISHDQSIDSLRKRVYLLEQHFVQLRNSPLFLASDFLAKIKHNIVSKYIIKKDKIHHLLLKVFRLILRLIYKIMCKFFSNNIRILNLILRVLNKFSMKFGYRIKNSSLLKQSLKVKEDQSLILKNEKELEMYYNSSTRAKRIYKDIND